MFHSCYTIFATAVLAMLFTAHAQGAAIQNAAVNDFSVPNPGVSVAAITTGPDGNLWFTETDGPDPAQHKIGRKSALNAADIVEFPAGATASSLGGIVAGTDGNLWFAKTSANQIARFNIATQEVTEFPLPTADAQPLGMVTGPDGKIWFTEFNAGRIGRIDPATSAVTEFATGMVAGAKPFAIAQGADGTLWFSQQGAATSLGRITAAGEITQFSVDANTRGVAGAPDGRIWFTKPFDNQIGVLDPVSGATTFIPVSTATQPQNIVVGTDGNLWFTAFSGNKIGRVNPLNNAVDEADLAQANRKPDAIVAGPNGDIWFTENGPGAVALLSVPEFADALGTIQLTAANFPASKQAGMVTITLERQGFNGNAAWVNFATADASARAPEDYTAASGTVMFAPGQTSRAISVQINAAVTRLDVASVAFNVNLSNPVGAKLGTASAGVNVANDKASQGGGGGGCAVGKEGDATLLLLLAAVVLWRRRCARARWKITSGG
jgi:streptogramin lyase